MRALVFALLAAFAVACGGDKPPMVPDPDTSVIDAGAD